MGSGPPAAPVTRTASVPRRRSLSVEDWARAALEAIAREGLAGVAVEPLARRLGVTKGSFYWHYPNREALLEAALEIWEQEETEAVIVAVERERDPRRRIEALVRRVVGTRRTVALHQALAAASVHPKVAAVLRRVSDRRLDYLVRAYGDLGLSPRLARQYALLAYGVYLGTLHLQREAAHRVPRGEEFSQYVDFLVRRLLPPQGRWRGRS